MKVKVSLQKHSCEHATINESGISAIATYALKQGFSLRQIHLCVGNEMLPAID